MLTEIIYTEFDDQYNSIETLIHNPMSEF